MKIGIPIIIAAPSGAGKTSLVRALVTEMDDIGVSVSHTTRPKRASETNHVNYHFVSTQKFEDLIKQDAFLEYARVFDNYYGTSKEWVDKQFVKGQDLIFEIDWQGARQLREKLPGAASIFILPPSLEALNERLHSRGQDDKAIIAKRMQEAKSEISHHDEFEYIIVNDDFDTAKAELMTIIQAERLKAQRHHDLASALLSRFS